MILLLYSMFCFELFCFSVFVCTSPCPGFVLGPSSHFLLALPPAQSFIYLLGKDMTLEYLNFSRLIFGLYFDSSVALWQNVHLGNKSWTEDQGFIHWTSVTIRDLPRYKDDQLARDGPNCVAVHDAWRKKHYCIFNKVMSEVVWSRGKIHLQVKSW